MKTTGRPAGLQLKADRTQLQADGQDATVVEVDVVDAQGRIVPDADNEITFSIAGAGHNLGVGNGDPSSHESDKGNTRRAFHGARPARPGREPERGHNPGERKRGGFEQSERLRSGHNLNPTSAQATTFEMRRTRARPA